LAQAQWWRGLWRGLLEQH